MRREIQSYLNIFSVIMNQPENKYEKVEKLLSRAQPSLFCFDTGDKLHSRYQKRGLPLSVCKYGFIFFQLLEPLGKFFDFFMKNPNL